MATTLTKEQLFQTILDQDARKLDVVADTRRMSSIVAPVTEGTPNRVVLDVDQPDGLASFVLNDYASSQVATDLGIPKRYFDRMLGEAPVLLRSNIDHWLANQPNRRLLRGFKPGGEGGFSTGRAWLSDRYKRLDNIEIAKRIFPVFDEIDGIEFHQAQITDTRFYVRAVLPRLQAEIKTGDVIQAGLEIRNSEVGAGTLSFNPFVLRLVCTNGMTVNEFGASRRHVGKRIGDDDSWFSDEAIQADDTAFWLAARDTAKSVLTEVRFQEIAARLTEIVHGEKIAAPIAATEELQQRYSLTDEEREMVLTKLVAEGDLSQWGLLNAVTATAKTVDSFDRQAELESLGWTIAQLPTREFAQLAVAR